VAAHCAVERNSYSGSSSGRHALSQPGLVRPLQSSQAGYAQSVVAMDPSNFAGSKPAARAREAGHAGGHPHAVVVIHLDDRSRRRGALSLSIRAEALDIARLGL